MQHCFRAIELYNSIMKKGMFLICIAFCLMLVSAKAEDSTKVDSIKVWKKGGIAGLNFAQTSLTNWQGGGENAIAGNALLSLFSNYKKGLSTWENTLDLAYGKIQTGKAALRKNDDKIDLNSKYGYSFSKNWNYSALFNFKSQFDDGYAYPNDSVVISHFLAPAYTLLAIGLDYKTTNNNFSLFISPLTGKTTIVNDQRLADAGAYGVEKATYDPTSLALIKGGNKIRNEFGGYLRMTYKKEVMKNVTFQTKLELFSNYINNPQNMDVNWENIVSLKVNKFITASITTNLIYDDDVTIKVDHGDDGVIDAVGPRVQYKQVLAVGFSYKF